MLKIHGHCARKRKAGRCIRESPTYTSWRAMIQRCTCKSHVMYPRYGGAGVTVDPRWLKFENFLADMGVRPKGTTLGRITPFSNYGPGEVEWQTPKQQAQTIRRQPRSATYKGRLLSDWAAELGLSLRTLRRRLQRGWGDRAFVTHKVYRG